MKTGGHLARTLGGFNWLRPGVDRGPLKQIRNAQNRHFATQAGGTRRKWYKHHSASRKYDAIDRYTEHIQSLRPKVGAHPGTHPAGTWRRGAENGKSYHDKLGAKGWIGAALCYGSGADGCERGNTGSQRLRLTSGESSSDSRRRQLRDNYRTVA